MNTIDKYTDPITFIKIVDRTIDEYIDDEVTTIGSYVFSNCTSLTTVDLPEVTRIRSRTFDSCSSLTTVNLPKATIIDSYAFSYCSNLTTVDLPKATSIDNNAFSNCTRLTTVILRNTEQVATLSSTNAFTGAPNPIFYVPDSLVESYKAANNWSTYANRIKGLSELPAA